MFLFVCLFVYLLALLQPLGYCYSFITIEISYENVFAESFKGEEGLVKLCSQ